MDSLMHTGTPHEGSIPHSGRYPWGSGENPNQRPKSFADAVDSMRDDGLSDSEIAKGFGMSERDFKIQYAKGLRARGLKTSEIAKKFGITEREFKSEYSNLVNEQKVEQKQEARALFFDKGMNKSEIAKHLGVSEGTVRNWIKDDVNVKRTAAQATAEVLKAELTKHKYLDVGDGTASLMGISSTRLENSLALLKEEGYEVHKIRVPQASNPKQMTVVQVLCPPGVTWAEAKNNSHQIDVVNSKFISPSSTSILGLKPIESISSKKIEVCYREDGGADKDGVIEIRRGVDGLDLGQARYAQVRIGVDGTHYLKGMAIYSDDLPEGIDIRFNTHHSKDDPKMKTKLDAFKAMKTVDGKPGSPIDTDNPFGSYIKPGGQKGFLNIVREEGDWTEWSKTLASQMLSKQSTRLASEQLAITRQIKAQELDEINSLTNPVLKKKLLEQYAESCDREAVHLKAASLPRQANKVILPLTSIPEGQIYAPGFKNGERVVLIRYPHGGTFEIPELTVNNNNREAKRLFNQAVDAVGIHPSTAERLSGADFDGDTVVVIPNNSRRVISTAPLKGLEGFDPKLAYPEKPGMKYMSKANTQKQMGIVSNLITDMTLKDAPPDDLAKAIRHSMVVIDAEKHKLNYKQSEIDNEIDRLQREYQPKPDSDSKKKYGGASTLISRAKSEVHVLDRERYSGNRGTDPVTGEKVYYNTNKTVPDFKYIKDPATGERLKVKTGTEHLKTIESTQMAEAKDARKLMSDRKTDMEVIYADHANGMKALANQARKDALSVPNMVRDPEAAKLYANEVTSLKEKVLEVQKYKPYERKAQILAAHVVALKKADNPSMTKDELKKIRRQAIAEQRSRIGGKRPSLTISDREWEAIQKGAVSKSTQEAVFKYVDQDALKQRAMPKGKAGLPQSKITAIKSMASNGYSQAEIAARLGVSSSTVSNVMLGKI